jgi:hypothetical protein
VSRQAGEYADQIRVAAQDAFIVGWQQAIWVGVVVMGVLAVIVLLRGPAPAGEKAEAVGTG